MFSVSMKTQYGLRALIRLCQAEGEELSIGEIASLEGISPKYLEGIAAQLKSAGLIVSQRGKHGGYRLAREPKSIRMREVITALEGDVTPVQCERQDGACGHSLTCLSKHFWDGLKERIDVYLDAVDLAALAAGSEI
jgi:Rrf2 family protein